MPATKTMELLVRKLPLAEGDWLRLLEARRKALAPILDNYTLPELSRYECLKIESHLHDVSFDRPEVCLQEGFSLTTQGIFGCQPWDKQMRTAAGGVKLVWGLVRSNKWVLVRVEYHNEAGYKGRGYQKATRVKVESTDLGKLLAETGGKPRVIWKVLNDAVTQVVARQAGLYNRVKAIEVQFAIEDQILTLVEEA